MAKYFRWAVAFAIILATTQTAQARPTERKAILDALRPSAERVWHAPVVFVVTEIKVYAGYAYVAVNPKRPNGGAIRMMLDFQAGDAYGTALLIHSHGNWRVLRFVAGGDDPWFCGYPGVPRQVLPSYCSN